MQVLSLALTGTGQIIAQLGQSCLNATCAAGVCTAGVCCDRTCTSSCQVCSAAGVCTDQSSRETCGNGSGRCFGVDQCLLPELKACTGDEQCGAHNCELRLGGQGPNDRICCLDDCGNTGQQCNPQTGHCQVPTLGQGAACGAAGQAACGDGLQCKQCLGGGNQCTPTNGCCNGCAAGYTCLDGACGCATGSNGRPQIDCGNGQCILDQALACCASAPQCPSNAPVCDGRAGLCRQCLAASDCPPGPQGTRASCNNFTCSYACNTQQGLKDCGNNRCVSQASCCSNADCGPCGVCNNNGSCQSQCANGQICMANNTCGFAAVGLGQTCNQQANNCNAGLRCGTNNTCQCANNTGQCGTQCFNLSSDSAHCGNCNVNCGTGFACVNGTCSCGTAREQIALSDPRNQTGPACLLFDGSSCNSNADCSSNTCTEFFLDLDGDGFGVGQPGQGQKICGLFGPAQSVGTLVDRGGDCCDLRIDGASNVHPGSTAAGPVPDDCVSQGVAANDVTCAAFNRR